jgi:type IV pilus biogenesis/stability protein PilW
MVKTVSSRINIRIINLMKKVLLSLLIMIMALVSVSCRGSKELTEEQKKMAQSHYQMGLSYFSEKNITKALQELIKAYEINPGDKEIAHLLGLLYLSKKEYEKAEMHVKEAITLRNGDFPKARNNLGVIYLEMERYDDAIREFGIAAKNILYDTPEFAYTNMGWAYYKKGDTIKAKENYEKSIETEPRYSLAYYNLGNLHFDLEEYDDALTQFKAAIKFFPNYLDAWYSLGLTHFKLSNLDEAKEALDKVIEIAPDTKKAEMAKGYLDLLK